MGLLLLALIISDLNKALYSSSLIGVICKLSIPISECPPRGAVRPRQLQDFPTWASVIVQVWTGEQACKICRWGHRERASVTRATPMWSNVLSVKEGSHRWIQVWPDSREQHPASICRTQAAVCLSVLPSSSTLLTWLKCLMEPRRSSSSGPMAIWQKKKKKNLRTSLGAVLAHKELCLSECSEALCS